MFVLVRYQNLQYGNERLARSEDMRQCVPRYFTEVTVLCREEYSVIDGLDAFFVVGVR